MKKFTRLAFALSITLTPYAWADYFATGPIEGNVCWGIGIEVCGLHKISAVQGDGGRLFEVQTRYNFVTEHKQSSGRCWIKTKSTGGGLISWGINATKQPVFLEQDSSGSYKKLDIEYITFKCEKR